MSRQIAGNLIARITSNRAFSHTLGHKRKSRLEIDSAGRQDDFLPVHVYAFAMIAWRPSSKRDDVWGGASVLLVGFVVALYALGVGSTPNNQLLAAVSTHQKEITVGWLSCLSIDPHQVVFDERYYWDEKLLGEIADKLSVKVVLPSADYAACRWGFFATVVPGVVSALKYNGEPAQYLISIGVCERRVDGSMTNKCVNKNVYVFNRRVAPHDLFSFALVGLARSQTDEFDMFKSERSH
jgi:hypothetical protein